MENGERSARGGVGRHPRIAALRRDAGRAPGADFGSLKGGVRTGELVQTYSSRGAGEGRSRRPPTHVPEISDNALAPGGLDFIPTHDPGQPP